MVVAELSGKLVFLDTSPLIYFIEGHSPYQQKLKELFVLNDKGNFRFVSSVITLLEVLVKPLKEKENKIVDQYKNILTNAEGIDIFDISISITIKAAKLRAKYNIRTPDALQVATAIEQSAEFFLTNDLRLKPVSEIKVLTLSELE